MTEQLILRKIVPSDFRDLHPLFIDMFGVKLDTEYWEWKYERNPNGKALCCVAEHEGRIVGQVSAIPVNLQSGAETMAATQTCDIVFLPEYRKGASSLKAFKILMNEHESRDVLLCYGFSNPVTTKVSTKLFNFRTACRVTRWVYILNPANYLRERLKMPVITPIAGGLLNLYFKLRFWKRRSWSGTNIVEINRFDERFDDFWEERKRDFEIMVVKNATYLNWRYFDNPMQNYSVYACVSGDRICGFTVLATASQEDALTGLIMDIMFDPKEKHAFDSLLSAAIDFFQRKKAVKITFGLPEANPLGERLKKWGFIPRDADYRFIIRLFEGKQSLNSKRFLDPKNWHFTLGDSDYY